MRLRLIQIPASPALGTYPAYSAAVALQELVRRQFLDAKAAAPKEGPRSPPTPPTVIAFTPRPTFTLGRRQELGALGAAAEDRLRAPLTVATRDEDAEEERDGGRRAEEPSRGRRRTHTSHTFVPEVVPSPRGGLTTYHGPGQAVLWAVLDLKETRWRQRHFTVRCYSRLLEDTTAEVLRRRYGVVAHTTSDPGLWVGREGERDGGGEVVESKIAALGVHLRRNISALGVSVNLDMPIRRVRTDSPPAEDASTNPWRRFTPCGLDKGVTCVAEQGRLRFGGQVPASWNLQPDRFAVKWAETLARRLGLEDETVEVAGADVVRQLLEQAAGQAETA